MVVRPGDRYALRLDEPFDAVVPGEARYVEPRIDPVSRTTRVVFDFETPAGALPSGVLVEVADRLPTEDDRARFDDRAAQSLAEATETD
jgi:multidrug efflux pump subunit AcrA (membrane-fusion protein)